jgi:anti-anti-sigma factor
MDWEVQERVGGLVGKPRGRVDEATWQDFASCLTDAVVEMTARPARKLVIDLSGIDYMSSRGLRALTVGKRQAEAAGLEISLASPNDIMREILAISRYDKIFKVTDTVEAAFD